MHIKTLYQKIEQNLLEVIATLQQGLKIEFFFYLFFHQKVINDQR